jgi:biopolymer transport protein ExbD
MTRRRKADEATRVVMPITPMLDMTFQLLFFFILNYHPSALEGQMAMSLPVDNAENAAHKQEDVKTTSEDDQGQLPADLTVMVKTQNDGINNGIISQLTVVGRSGAKEVKDLADLTAYLKDVKAREQLSNKDDVTIKGDSRLTWKSMMQVVDACRGAGFNIGFGAPPDLGLGQQ